MNKRKKLTIAAAVAATVFVLAAATTVIAGPNASLTGAQISAVKTLSGELSQPEDFRCSPPEEPTDDGCVSPGFVDAPGIAIKFSVSRRQRLVLARFQADANCHNSANISEKNGDTGTTPFNQYNQTGSLQQCYVELALDGQVMKPGESLFARAEYCGEYGCYVRSLSHSIERSSLVAPGEHEIKVRMMSCCHTTRFTLRNWHLTVENIDASIIEPPAGQGGTGRSPQADDPRSGDQGVGGNEGSFAGNWAGTALAPDGDQVLVSATLTEDPEGAISGTADWGAHPFTLSGRARDGETGSGVHLESERDAWLLDADLTFSREEGGPHLEGNYQLTRPNGGRQPAVEEGSITLVPVEGSPPTGA